MHDVQPIRLAGSVIQERFVIEELLGKGGFSAVYLVRDVQDGDTRYALKELIYPDKQEKKNFVFEGRVLERLDHPALPHVHQIIEDGMQVCILMDYIEGQDLNVLRRQQLGERFPLDRVLPLLTTVVDALRYLHGQETPIVHRDIKPANIIVPRVGEKSVLVDFGIAKEYNSDDTTMAVRRCSPGYGAPEQYTGGTDVRTDIYGLAATIYTLLTGEVPVDAMVRTTSIATKHSDPLIPIQRHIPSLPTHVAQAIGRAMSVNSEARFASVDEFWRALQTPISKSDTTLARPRVTILKNAEQSERLPKPPAVHPHTAFFTRKIEVVLLALLAVAVVAGLLFGVNYYKLSLQGPKTQPNTVTASIATLTPATSTQNSAYPKLVGPYTGTIHNMVTNEKTPMSLTGIAQSTNSVTGYFIGMNNEGKFVGVLDTSRHFLFTVPRNGQLSLFFNGVVKQSGAIVGTYCAQDKAGQCAGDYGEWSLKNA